MSSRVEFEVPDDALEALDSAIAAGQFEDRQTAFEAALRRVWESSAIAASYRRVYAAKPEDEDYGEAGLRLMSDQIRKPHPGSN